MKVLTLRSFKFKQVNVQCVDCTHLTSDLLAVMTQYHSAESDLMSAVVSMQDADLAEQLSGRLGFLLATKDEQLAKLMAHVETEHTSGNPDLVLTLPYS